MNSPKFLKSKRNRLIFFGTILILWVIATIYFASNEESYPKTLLDNIFQSEISKTLLIAIPVIVGILIIGISNEIFSGDLHEWLKGEDNNKLALQNIEPNIENLFSWLEEHYSEKLGRRIEINHNVNNNQSDIIPEENDGFVRTKQSNGIEIFPSKKVYARINLGEFDDWRKEFTVRYPLIEGIKSESINLKINSILSYEKVFDISLVESVEGDTWLNELDYSIQFFKEPFLNLMFYMEGTGAYSWTVTRSVVINYITGDLVGIEDIFNGSALKRLASIVDEFRQIDFEKAKLEEKYIGEIPLIENDSLNEYERNNSWLEEMNGQEKFTIEDLNEFSLDEYGITFIYHFGFPHVIKNLEPAGKYHFGYESLKEFIIKDSVLEEFIKENSTYLVD